jgi:hypothetical protein
MPMMNAAMRPKEKPAKVEPKRPLELDGVFEVLLAEPPVTYGAQNAVDDGAPMIELTALQKAEVAAFGVAACVDGVGFNAALSLNN